MRHTLYSSSLAFPGLLGLSRSGCAVWLKPLFEALWGDFGNDSILPSPLQGMDAERLVSQAWLKDSKKFPYWGSSPPSAWAQA